jgi:hypothetical protein
VCAERPAGSIDFIRQHFRGVLSALYMVYVALFTTFSQIFDACSTMFILWGAVNKSLNFVFVLNSQKQT